MPPVVAPVKPSSNERGIVLAAALLFVLLASLLVMTLMLTTTGERTQSSNTQTAKIALYAADAGIRTQQQELANLAKLKLDSCYAGWVAAGQNPSQPIIGNPNLLFPVGVLGGVYAVTSTNPSFSANVSVMFADSAVTPASQTFDYQFTIQSSGGVRATGKRSVQSTGVIRVSASRGSFADYLLLTDQFKMSNNGTVYFTSADNFDGRVHTNDAFKFAYNPAFQDRVTQVGANATFYNDGSPVVLNANNNGAIDVPNFFGGYLRSQGAIPLPNNGNDQQSAALGLSLPSGTAPTNAQINTALGQAGTGAPPTGIYVPNDAPVGSLPISGANHITGGIYVQGSADMVKMWADTLLNRQYYTINQGSTHRAIEIAPGLTPGSGTTTVWNKTNPSGPPDMVFLGTPANGTVLFTNGGIDDLEGPGRTPSTGYVNPALAANQRALVAAAGDVVIQGDLTCDSYNDKTNVLGIFSVAGAVRIGVSAPDNLNVDAFVMACGNANGQFCVDNHDSGGPRGTMTLRGGCVSRFYGAFYTWDANGNLATGYGRNFHYDRRGLIPPTYPTTTKFVTDTPTARTIAWKEI